MARAVLLITLLLVLGAGVAPQEASAHCAGGSGRVIGQVPPPPDDLDCDFVKDNVDNCPPLGYDDLRTRNPNQEDSDHDGVGDWCQADDDGDGIDDWTDHNLEYESTKVKLDNCRTVANPGQEDDNNNRVGNVCERDDDRDGVLDSEDNCKGISNPSQADVDNDRIGDPCDADADGDFTRDSEDNCPGYPNPDQRDDDRDGIGALCDADDTPAAMPAATPTPEATVSTIDREAPRVTLSVRGTQRVAEVEDGLIVRLRCSEACAAKAELRVSKSVARRLKLRGTVVGTGTARMEAAASTYAFVRFAARVRSRLFKQSRTALTLTVTATDPAGNVRRKTDRLVLRT